MKPVRTHAAGESLAAYREVPVAPLGAPPRVQRILSYKVRYQPDGPSSPTRSTQPQARVPPVPQPLITLSLEELDEEMGILKRADFIRNYNHDVRDYDVYERKHSRVRNLCDAFEAAATNPDLPVPPGSVPMHLCWGVFMRQATTPQQRGWHLQEGPAAPDSRRQQWEQERERESEREPERERDRERERERTAAASAGCRPAWQALCMHLRATAAAAAGRPRVPPPPPGFESVAPRML